MMKLTKEDVLYTAKLSRLEFSEEEMDTLAEKMSDVLEYANELSAVDTEDVKPLTHVIEKVNVLREDVVKTGLTLDEALQNAPDKEDRTFKVPNVLW